jgi:nucleotide-binding universal stress UspA family protein
METFSQILLPLDGSESSRSSLATARDLALRYQAEVTVFSCVDLSDLTSSGIEMTPHGFMSRLDEAKEEQSVHLDKAIEELEAAGVVARKRIDVGKPVDRILEAASSENVDLIIMASHGRTGFRRWIMGSVTEGVLRRAGCRILVVPCKPK